MPFNNVCMARMYGASALKQSHACFILCGVFHKESVRPETLPLRSSFTSLSLGFFADVLPSF